MLIICFQVLLFTALCLSQRILLVDSIQSDSTTKCDQGLIQATDYLVFKAEVNFDGAPNDWGKNIILELKTEKHSESFTVFLKNCDNPFNSVVCKCKKLGFDSFEIVCRVLANTNYSKAELRGKLTNINGHVKYSDTIILPEIFDLSVEIVANEVVVTQGQCIINMIQTDPALRVCCKQSPIPCKVSVFTSGKHLGTNEECVHVEKSGIP